MKTWISIQCICLPISLFIGKWLNDHFKLELEAKGKTPESSVSFSFPRRLSLWGTDTRLQASQTVR